MTQNNIYHHTITADSNFRPGWYELYISTDHNIDDLKCSLEFGDDLPNYDNIHMEALNGARISTLIYLDFNPDKITLESISKRPVIISKITLKKCSPVKLYRKIARKGWSRLIEDPIGNTPRLIRSFISLFSSHHYRQIRTQHVSKKNTYSNWIKKHDYSSDKVASLHARLAPFKARPKISLLIAVYKVDPDLIRQTINSVKNQIYPHWEVSLCFDGGTPQTVKSKVKELTEGDARFILSENQTNQGISYTTNTAFQNASGDWTGFLDHDDLLPENALMEMAIAICENADANIIYSDEDKISEDGQRFDPHFKCDFSPELILAMNYINHFTVMRSSMVKKAGLWRKAYDGAQDYDMVLRIIARSRLDQIIHIPKILYHWRASESSEANARGVKHYSQDAGMRAVKYFLETQDEKFTIKQHPLSGYNQINFKLLSQPKVTIIIPTKDKHKLLKTCVSSILNKTLYPNYEILIVDNGSKEAKTHQYFEQLKQNQNIHILKYDVPFNYSQINNYAVQHATGDIICFLNNDIEVLSPEWLGNMVSWLQREGVGAVGAKLLYPDKTIQHAGIIMGIGLVAGHSHKYFPNKALGYYARLVTPQNFSAVTGACLMVRKKDFQHVEGFDEDNLPISYNDIDLCLKLREKGLRIIWSPEAQLIHHESATRGKFQNEDTVRDWTQEAKFMRQKWERIISADPYYSPNLSRQTEDFSFKM